MTTNQRPREVVLRPSETRRMAEEQEQEQQAAPRRPLRTPRPPEPTTEPAPAAEVIEAEDEKGA
jgi:hypothetical protein